MGSDDYELGPWEQEGPEIAEVVGDPCGHRRERSTLPARPNAAPTVSGAIEYALARIGPALGARVSVESTNNLYQRVPGLGTMLALVQLLEAGAGSGWVQVRVRRHGLRRELVLDALAPIAERCVEVDALCRAEQVALSSPRPSRVVLSWQAERGSA